jgi:hypothetical protein
LIEVPNQQWAISTEGLFSIDHYYHISAQRITASSDNWPRHMRTLSWVNPAAFDEAYSLARRLLLPRLGSDVSDPLGKVPAGMQTARFSATSGAYLGDDPADHIGGSRIGQHGRS